MGEKAGRSEMAKTIQIKRHPRNSKEKPFKHKGHYVSPRKSLQFINHCENIRRPNIIYAWELKPRRREQSLLKRTALLHE